MKLELYRHRNTINKTVTLGTMCVESNDGKEVFFSCKTLELPWRNNERKNSCIPTGTYTISRRNSNKYGNHFIVDKVKGRTAILIHVGNWVEQTKGCILVGEGFKDLDTKPMITNSRKALNKLLEALPLNETIKLTIHN